MLLLKTNKPRSAFCCHKIRPILSSSYSEGMIILGLRLTGYLLMNQTAGEFFERATFYEINLAKVHENVTTIYDYYRLHLAIYRYLDVFYIHRLCFQGVIALWHAWKFTKSNQYVLGLILRQQRMFWCYILIEKVIYLLVPINETWHGQFSSCLLWS